MDFFDNGHKMKVSLEDGCIFEGNILVGIDDICLKLQAKLLGEDLIVYLDYTCYIIITNFVLDNIIIIGYGVFLGHKQYFVSLDMD